MILLIDNYDSFTYNIVDYLKQLKADVYILENDKELDNENIDINKISHIVIGPGPCSPNEAGISLKIIEMFEDKKPILGICLGHQSIGQYFGAEVNKAQNLMHGKTSKIYTTQESIFENLPKEFLVMRYHSLSINNIPKCLKITAKSDDGEIQAIEHINKKIFGVQFHPESIGTEFGMEILSNFLKI